LCDDAVRAVQSLAACPSAGVRRLRGEFGVAGSGALWASVARSACRALDPVEHLPRARPSAVKGNSEGTSTSPWARYRN
jgi:hypothetical protein